MAIRNILINGDPRLRKLSRHVDKFDDKLSELIDDMFQTMYKREGCGLAAPQVGILKRLFVYDVGDGPIAFVNPEIIKTEGEILDDEGCLSVPDFRGCVARPAEITVRAQDKNGKWFIRKFTELGARCVCHETDHLDGVLFIDKLSDNQAKSTVKDEH